MERLDHVTDVPLALVSAPAGFGKTTLLAEWLARREAGGLVAAWVSLDPGDNDPVVFWRYVVAAVQAARPGSLDRAQAVLDAAPTPTDAELALLLTDLAAADQEMVVVLDDIHVVESGEVRAQLAFVVDHLPPRAHLVLAGRADPALPLARRRAAGDLVEIRAADLRFTAAETSAYLAGAVGVSLTPADLATLEDRTEGWIAALQLAGLSMQGRPDVGRFIAGFAGDDRFVVDYLVEEVLQRQPPDVRQFLLRTSVLARMDGDLCDAVVGRPGSHALLAALERRNLFVVPLDDRRHAYRYHHLFGDVLRAHLLAEDAALVPELHRRASRWHEAHGDDGEAIRHALAAGDAERAADLVEVAIPALRRARQEVTLHAWTTALPDDVLRRRPVLTVGYVGSLMARGELDGVEERLRDAERWLDASDPGSGDQRGPEDRQGPADLQDPVDRQGPVVVDRAAFADLPAQVAVYRAGQALLSGDLTATRTHARRALERARPDDHVTQGSAAALQGLADWNAADLDAAERHYADAVGHLRAAGYLPDSLGCSLALADIQVARGRLDDAVRTLESGLRLGTSHDPPLRGTADMHVGLARVLLERARLDAARAHLDAARDLGEHAGLPQNAYRLRLDGARLLLAEGDAVGALAVLDGAERVRSTDYSPDVRPLGAVRARLHLAAGDVHAALAWSREAGLAAGDEVTYLHEYEHLTLVRVLLALARQGHREHLAGATSLLGRLEIAAGAGGRGGSLIEVWALQALALQEGGDGAAAVTALARAVTAAEPLGHVRLFLDEGAPMTALLRTLASRGDASGSARRILAAGASPRPTEATPQPVLDPLSARELEVLRLLASDLDGPAIARTLVVSLNTVRTHTKNIYTKLGVSSRRAAVSRARRLGLLP